MSTIILEKTSDLKLGLPHKQAQRLFSDMLGEVLNAIQKTLESQEPSSKEHLAYLEFARSVITDIKCYVGDFRTLTEFFVHPSNHYWPHDADPNLYAAGIVSYCIRLAQQPEKTSFELFYYLHGGWKTALISGRMASYQSCVRKGSKRWEFASFMLSEFVPAILEAGFESGGWLLCSTFLPSLVHHITVLLDKDNDKSQWVFEQMINLLKIIMIGITAKAQQFQDLPGGVHPQHRGILSVVFNFWFALAAPMRQFVERNPEQESSLEQVTTALSTFIFQAIQSFHDSEAEIFPPAGHLDIKKGRFTDRFSEVITKDIKDNWDFVDDWGFEIVVRGRLKEESLVQRGRDILGEVLERDVQRYRAFFPVEGEMVREVRNTFVEFLEF